MSNPLIIVISISILLFCWAYINFKRKEKFDLLNGKLDGQTFQPYIELSPQFRSEESNRQDFLSEIEHRIYFPWKDVKRCFRKVLPREKFKHYRNCPKCGRTSDQLVWILFTSPRCTWRSLCGRSGPLSICPECKIQVEFILECLN